MLPLLRNRDQDTAFPQIPSNNPALARVASIGAVGYSLWKSAHIQVARHGFKCFALRLPVDLHVFFPEMCWGYWELFKWVQEWETQAEEGLFHPLSSSLLSVPLPAASFAPSAAQCASASLPAAASCTPPARGAAAPAAAAASERPRTVPCFPAAVSGNHVGGLILQAH